MHNFKIKFHDEQLDEFVCEILSINDLLNEDKIKNSLLIIANLFLHKINKWRREENLTIKETYNEFPDGSYNPGGFPEYLEDLSLTDVLKGMRYEDLNMNEFICHLKEIHADETLELEGDNFNLSFQKEMQPILQQLQFLTKRRAIC